MNRAVVLIAVASALVMAVGACSGGNGNGNGSGDGGGGGGMTFVCDQSTLAGVLQCTKTTNLSASDYGVLKTNCTTQMGAVVSACPTANVIGCCTDPAADAEGCFYMGAPAPMTATQCAMVGGTWSTTP
jgi:hypothetical protein